VHAVRVGSVSVYIPAAAKTPSASFTLLCVCVCVRGRLWEPRNQNLIVVNRVPANIDLYSSHTHTHTHTHTHRVLQCTTVRNLLQF